ncbi:uroporphyrinogen-III synthase [Sphingomonas aracearum]|uniref:Uroporphyrinogen-III synthase n=1 Tax=Sphingomonas aracearum TaxID=2283317 RepID=A0A369VY19_9SPHN|nr:uroporphyrinogen-III synthase [Sphingomonas aracearum]RDE06030.1 uroporphyrinogen-III synthase [Sphingomonas aracearum]
MRPVAVLRPEPGNAATCARVADRGWPALALPLFAIRPLAWSPPDAAAFDALLLTSANAARHGGDQLRALAALPVVAVGEATAAAARGAGLTVELTGNGDAISATAMARAHGLPRLLHLGGRERRSLPDVLSIAVYASEALDDVDAAPLAGSLALLHSPRAASRLAGLVAEPIRRTIALAAISPAASAVAGTGWQALATASAPTDAALLDAAARLLD